MNRSGMTLIEVILSLVMVSVLAVLSINWVTAAQRGLAETTERTSWRRAAGNTLQLLHDDLASADLDSGDTAVRTTTDHAPTTITFTSRVAGHGRTLITYSFDRASRTLTRSIGEQSRVLLGNVTAWTVEPIDSDEHGPSLRVLIEHAVGFSFERWIPIAPREFAS